MRVSLPACALVLAACSALASSTARADILASPCEVEYFQKYLGERCVQCEASEYEPERCRNAYADKGLVPRCAGSGMGNIQGFSMWGEVWCLPRGTPETTPLPPELPPVERDDPGGSLPKRPPDLPNPPPLAPPVDPPAPPSSAPPAAPAAVATHTRESFPALAPPPPQGCGCHVDPTPLTLLAALPLLALRRRRR